MGDTSGVDFDGEESGYSRISFGSLTSESIKLEVCYALYSAIETILIAATYM